MRSLIVAIVLSQSLFASSLVDAKYTISKLITKDGKSLVAFVESATFYEAKGKVLSCIQEATKNESKVEVKYDYKTYQIKSCKLIK